MQPRSVASFSGVGIFSRVSSKTQMKANQAVKEIRIESDLTSGKKRLMALTSAVHLA